MKESITTTKEPPLTIDSPLVVKIPVVQTVIEQNPTTKVSKNTWKLILSHPAESNDLWKFVKPKTRMLKTKGNCWMLARMMWTLSHFGALVHSMS